jgi:beta-mannosidase
MSWPASTPLTDWELVADDGTTRPVSVPGTVTQAFPDALDADSRMWVFRTQLPDVPGDLVLEGVATSYEVVVDGEVLLRERSMHARHRLAVSGRVLELRCLPLATAAPESKAPRARWRAAIADNSLRLIRTCLLGRMPGIAPGPPVVGPYRSVRLEVARPSFEAMLEGSTGRVRCSDPSVTFTCAGVTGVGVVTIPDATLWWPHTHGDPVLHDVTVDGVQLARVGFRSLTLPDEGFGFIVNGVPIWARGAVWTPPGLLAGTPENPWETVLLARDAGMNLLRVPGTAPYETPEFFAACDELGVMVWHDLALANLDVPHDLLDLDREVTDLLERTAGHPSLVAVCGGSETAQQVAMLGMDPSLWRSDFLDQRAQSAVADRALWVRNSPYGEGLPFRNEAGVAHYFGVGGYRRPLSDVRSSNVSFAAECLAFSHGEGDFVPRDHGATWDFADVTDHYAALLSRPRDLVVGEVMAEVFGEWRRAGSPNRGAIMLWLRDLQPGAGWGLLRADGTPKPAWYDVRRALAARSAWFVDEGLNGLALHVANDRSVPWETSLRLAFYRADGLRLDEVTTPVNVDAHGQWSTDVEALLGRFVDVTWSYRFGPASVAAVVATVDTIATFAYPAGHPVQIHAAEVLSVVRDGSTLEVRTELLLDSLLVGDEPVRLEPGVPVSVPVGSGPITITSTSLASAVIVPG